MSPTRDQTPKLPRALVVMGVSGCGKTLIGSTLAERLGGQFFDGDDFHPPENIEKMSNGTPLDDADRQPWLERLRSELLEPALEESGPIAVVACSALRRSYRDILRGESHPQPIFVYLKGEFDLIFSRMSAREDHYMKEGMLRSQFAVLEEPGDDEGSLALSIAGNPEQIVSEALERLSLIGGR